MLYAEKQILDKNKLKNNNLSLKSPKNLQKIEIFGPPIKGPIPRASTPEDAFILHQPKLFQQNINKDNENILDNNKLKAPKIPPWWTWKKMAVQNEKKNNLEDFTNKCCQWALDGLCDRSWQRIRELCPKSCGTVLCSSFEGTLSCSRVLDVDVIGCYERRKQNNSFISTNSNKNEMMAFEKENDEKINERKIDEKDNFI
ncbi:hypothetical protein ACQ4LE_003129 [Meloidogyne hapla]